MRLCIGLPAISEHQKDLICRWCGVSDYDRIHTEMKTFSQRVYKVVAMIPRGSTMSYKGVAFAIGQPKAYRAVGNALNKNPFAPQVPCHRVIRSDGTVGGFAQGTRKKIQLLRKEKAIK